MPENNPQVREVWSTSDVSVGRTVFGVVSEVISNVITLVSLTGNRVRVPPSRFFSAWQYVRTIPEYDALCSVHGCDQCPVVQVAERYYVCPRHIPAGAQSEFIADDVITTTQSIIVPPCPSCGASNLQSHARLPEGIEPERDVPTGLFLCQSCNLRFVFFAEFDFSRLETLAGRLTLSRVFFSHSAFTRVYTGTPLFLGSIAVERSNHLAVGVALVTTINTAYRGPVVLPSLEHNQLSILPILPPAGSRWINAASGALVRVLPHNANAVHFENTSDSNRAFLTISDFYSYHRVCTDQNKTLPLPLAVGEEWWIEGEIAMILEVFLAENYLIVRWGENLTQWRVPFTLLDNRWTKAVRPTIYDRLTGEDEI